MCGHVFTNYHGQFLKSIFYSIIQQVIVCQLGRHIYFIGKVGRFSLEGEVLVNFSKKLGMSQLFGGSKISCPTNVAKMNNFFFPMEESRFFMGTFVKPP